TVEPVTPLPGDANGDGVVDGLDYNTWSLHYLEQPVPAWADGGWEYGNFNADAVVDGLDYNVWSMHYLEELGEGSAGAGAAEAGAEMGSLTGPVAAAGQVHGRRAGSGPASSMLELPGACGAALGKLLVAEGRGPAWPTLPADRGSDQPAQPTRGGRVEGDGRDGHSWPLVDGLEALSVPSLWVLRSAV
ncbi:MAG: hypothetical protein AMJ81_08130, partial [Phycisphaerae bacterium SM23_33]